MQYYRTILALYRKRTGDGSYPQFFLNSIDLKREIELIERNELHSLADFMLFELEKLSKAGADFAIIASNTPHIIFDELENRSALPLLSIVETACQATQAQKLKRVALFGTRFTMQGQFYPEVFSRRGIELVIPSAEDQEYIHHKYMDELVVGTFLPETRGGLLRIIDDLKGKQHIEGVLLGGTELPLILPDERHNQIPLIDTMRIHAEAAVAEMFA